MIYHIYANRSNIGDWLSAKGIQQLLSPLPITECLCDGPFVNETIHTISKCRQGDLIVIGGGGLLMDYFEPFWEAFRPLASRVPFVIWGIGCCDLKQEKSLPSSQLMEEIARQSTLCFVRDELSRSFLNIDSLPAPVSCPSLNALTVAPRQEGNILHVANYTTAGAKTYDAMRHTCEEFAQRNRVIFRETNNRIQKDDETAMNQLLTGHYGQSDLVVSSALHGCIIAVAMGRKVVAVSGDRKIDAFMKAVGLGEWVLDTSQVGQLNDFLYKISEQKHPFHALQQIRKANEEIAKRVKKIVAEITDNVIG